MTERTRPASVCPTSYDAIAIERCPYCPKPMEAGADSCHAPECRKRAADIRLTGGTWVPRGGILRWEVA